MFIITSCSTGVWKLISYPKECRRSYEKRILTAFEPKKQKQELEGNYIIKSSIILTIQPMGYYCGDLSKKDVVRGKRSKHWVEDNAYTA
jgi:hypothetical protein